MQIMKMSNLHSNVKKKNAPHFKVLYISLEMNKSPL